MTPVTVHADGIAWPLDTYIDAYRMQRVDRFDPPSLGYGEAGAIRVIALTPAGVLLPPVPADTVIWRDVIAFRPLEGTPAAVPCRICSEPCMRADYSDLCEGCDAYGEFGW